MKIVKQQTNTMRAALCRISFIKLCKRVKGAAQGCLELHNSKRHHLICVVCELYLQ